MSDALTTGAERLERALCREDDHEDETPMSEFFATDPGVKALVEYVQRQIDCGGALVMEDARAALKLWEHGS